MGSTAHLKPAHTRQSIALQSPEVVQSVYKPSQVGSEPSRGQLFISVPLPKTLIQKAMLQPYCTDVSFLSLGEQPGFRRTVKIMKPKLISIETDLQGRTAAPGSSPVL